MKRLIAGPWIGEFGWELMSWQAYVRKLAKGYDEVVVSTFFGHEPLYRDFATKVITHKLAGVKDCWRMPGAHPVRLRQLHEQLGDIDGDFVRPERIVGPDEQEFIRYGRPDHVKSFDVVVHARARVGKRPHHSYPKYNWDVVVKKLTDQGLSVAAVGTESFLPEGAANMRMLDLGHLMDLIAGSVVCVGPSSGPMHLASLCGTSHVVWTDKQWYSAIRSSNRKRYEETWNPHKTPCTVLDEFGWCPPPEVVVDAVLEEIDGND
jgi:hypothetical protein